MQRVDQRKVRAMVARIAALQVYLEELDAELKKPAPAVSRTRAIKFAKQVEQRAAAVATETRAIVNELRPAPDPLQLPKPSAS
jgi:hypothetical protein